MKRVLAVLSIATLCGTLLGASSMTVAAAGIKDLTGDNQYTLADAVLLSRIVDGKADYSGIFTDLDITGDYIVDQIDVVAYTRYLAGLAY